MIIAFNVSVFACRCDSFDLNRMVTVVGGAVILWLDNRVQVGSVVAATMLVLRIDSMSKWVIHLLTGIFRALGKVSEGMETIAQPVTLVDAPKAKPLQVPQAMPPRSCSPAWLLTPSSLPPLRCLPAPGRSTAAHRRAVEEPVSL